MLLRLTKPELDDVTAKARKAGLSREEYVRRTLSGAVIKEAPSLDTRSILRELRRIGYNINALLIRAYSTGFADMPQYRKDVEELRKTVKLIVKAYSEDS